jgi:hypothetical protein
MQYQNLLAYFYFNTVAKFENGSLLFSLFREVFDQDKNGAQSAEAS